MWNWDIAHCPPHLVGQWFLQVHGVRLFVLPDQEVCLGKKLAYSSPQSPRVGGPPRVGVHGEQSRYLVDGPAVSSLFSERIVLRCWEDIVFFHRFRIDHFFFFCVTSTITTRANDTWSKPYRYVSLKFWIYFLWACGYLMIFLNNRIFLGDNIKTRSPIFSLLFPLTPCHLTISSLAVYLIIHWPFT